MKAFRRKVQHVLFTSMFGSFALWFVTASMAVRREPGTLGFEVLASVNLVALAMAATLGIVGLFHSLTRLGDFKYPWFSLVIDRTKDAKNEHGSGRAKKSHTAPANDDNTDGTGNSENVASVEARQDAQFSSPASGSTATVVDLTKPASKAPEA